MFPNWVLRDPQTAQVFAPSKLLVKTWTVPEHRIGIHCCTIINNIREGESDAETNSYLHLLPDINVTPHLDKR